MKATTPTLRLTPVTVKLPRRVLRAVTREAKAARTTRHAYLRALIERQVLPPTPDFASDAA